MTFDKFIEIGKQVLAYFGGISVVVFLTIRFCKQLIEKLIHTQIEKSAEKELEKVKNNLARNMSAYEILLQKEFEYYAHIDEMYAKIIVDVQDIYWYALEANDVDFAYRCKKLKKISCRTLKKIPELKNYNLMYQVYVPVEIFDATGNVVIALQEGCGIIAETVANFFNKEEIDKDVLQKYKEDILCKIAFSSAIIRSRLERLSEN